MENKPFDLQSPIKIASEYGGNKQKIAEASKMGIVDPTAALLAGMFIDRMRSAQQAEMTPQQTVAQQVFSPQPSPPPPGAMPQGGPPQGGPPRGAPPMPMGGAPMPPPPPPQGGPPMGMASGGLMSIPVPDAMFDEPDNGGYANGGIVAFASAGDVRLKRLKQQYDGALRALGLSSMNEQSAGAVGSGTMADANDITGGGPYPSKGKGIPYEIAQGFHNLYGTPAPSAPVVPATTPTGIDPDLPNPATYGQPYKINPPAAAPPVTKPAAPRMGGPAAPAAAPVAPDATTATDDGVDEYKKMLESGYANRTAAVDDIKKMMGADKARPELDALREANKKALSPEEQKKDKEQDMWMTLAQIGAGMAATKSPNFMQAAGESIQAALPGMIADRKARKAEVKDALKEQAALEGMDRQEAREYAKMGLDEYNNYTKVLLQAQELADNKEYRKAALVLDRYRAENENRNQQAATAVSRLAATRPSAGAEEYARYVQNPTQFRAFSEAQYAGRGAAANPFGGRLGTGGGGTNPYAGFSIVGQ